MRWYADCGLRTAGYQDRPDPFPIAIATRDRVIYEPETECWSHYFHTRLPDQFDVMIHLDETSALRPLETNPGWERGELPETYPFAESRGICSDCVTRATSLPEAEDLELIPISRLKSLSQKSLRVRRGVEYAWRISERR